jgi:glycosyltransferase involved in cell wall biosynthesis
VLRVAVDATPLLGQRTGVGVVTAGLLQGLCGRLDLELRAFAMSWRGRHDMGAVLPAGVGLVRGPMAAAALQRAWAHVDGPVIEWWTGPLDVVHGTNFVVPPAARAAEVVTVHDLTSMRFPEMCQPATLRYPALIRRAIRRGAWVHTVSQAVAEEVVELLGAPAERVRVVAPGVGRPAGVVSAGVARPWGGRPYVLCLGRAEPRKDLPLLVRAFDEVAAAVPDVALVMAGPRGWADDALTRSVDSAHHRDRIFRLGWICETEKAALLAGATVFAYPSVYEGFGIPPLEAMAAGVPVVATAAGGVPEAVGPAAEMVPVGDRAALSATLARLLGDSDARARLIAAGHQRVEGFTWDRCAGGLHALYCEAAAARH